MQSTCDLFSVVRIFARQPLTLRPRSASIWPLLYALTRSNRRPRPGDRCGHLTRRDVGLRFVRAAATAATRAVDRASSVSVRAAHGPTQTAGNFPASGVRSASPDEGDAVRHAIRVVARRRDRDGRHRPGVRGAEGAPGAGGNLSPGRCARHHRPRRRLVSDAISGSALGSARRLHSLQPTGTGLTRIAPCRASPRAMAADRPRERIRRSAAGHASPVLSGSRADVLFRCSSRSSASSDSISTRCEPHRVRIVRSRPSRIR